ncbi:MAG TPA: bifunctional 4'-phosphopantothenoylcysteine decarboxylase/phosphopantothenoylcysteine synthetase, partial [Nitrospiraceae bacterium]|nr:bifunctional 4'-phosphopantothenoylcysteine decarboxylase/phosphopantothenoylcysteine synthetase [Nitrospiraceae bacterium]
ADILAELGKNASGRVLVGFAAETDQVLEHARAKLKAKNLDLIIANDLNREGAGFGEDTNIVTMITRSGETTDLPLMSKDQIAAKIVDKVAEILRKQGESA